jgi:hypothetical protein
VYEFDRVEPYQQFRDVMDQHDQLPCSNYPDAFFYDDETQSRGKRWNYQIAKELCSLCPIRVQCLDYALAADEDYGVWGGLSPVERRQLKRKKIRGGKNG